MKKNNLLYYAADLFFSMRPILLIPVWGFTIFGYFKSKQISFNNLLTFWTSSSLSDYFYILNFSLSVAVVYIINQIADVEVDKKNGGLPLIASGIVKLSDAWMFSILLSAISIFVPIFTHRPELCIFSIISIAIGFLYSFKPFFFSGRPILDFLTNAFGYGCCAFGLGWWLGGKTVFSTDFIIASLPYILLMCAGSISSTIPDSPGDKKEGKFTTAVAFGEKAANYLALLILITAFIASIITNDKIAIFCSILPLPFYIGYCVKQSTFMMEATYKIGGGICMISAVVLMPFILILSLIIFYSTKTYFKIRHNVSYPSMTNR